MTFLAPSVLAGLGVIAAPVAIHLLNKMRVQIINWGAMRFLLESIRKNQRRLQVEDLILLLLRCLLIALLALAFARPVINPEGTGAASSGGPAVAILIFDQSASMGQSNGVTTRFETAKAKVGAILDELPNGSQAGLYLVSDKINQVVPRPTSNLAVVRRTIEVSEPSDRPSDLLPAIRLALDTLRPFSGSRKEIVIFTDNQLVAWKQFEQIKPMLAEAADVNVKLVPLGGEGEDNLAITSLKAENMVPAAGELYGCMVEVSNFSATPATGVHVTLSLDDDPPSDEATIDSIPAGQSRAVRLNVKFPQAGFHTLKATIPADRLPVDNQRALAVQVIDQMRAVIVEGTQPRLKQDRDAMFLANALMPVAISRRPEYYLKAEAFPASWLEDADLSRQEMIFLANVGTISPAVATKLTKYVDDGGALIIFPGPNSVPEDMNNALKDILPATLGAMREPGKQNPLTPFVSWQSTNLPHPITSLWNDSKNGSLSSIHASKYYPLTLVPSKTPADQALVVVKYNDGTPAVAERHHGKGDVVLFSTPGNRIGDWTNLPLHPAFVPLVQRLAAFVVKHEGTGSLSVSPGGVYQQVVNADLVGRDYSVVRPDSKGQPRIAGKVELVNREAMVRYRDTEKSGPYRILINGSDRPVGAFAVQMDPQESNLRAIPEDSLAGISKDQKEAVATAATAPAGGQRREFWALLIWLAAIVAIVEMMLAHKFSLAK